MQKRGQVTFYVIMGLFVLAMVILILSLRNQIFRSEWDTERARNLQVPEKAREIQSTVASCIAEVSEEGLNRMSAQGGYIKIPEDRLPQTQANLFSNTLRVLPKSDVKVSYWSYVTANNVKKNQKPAKESMQLELAAYMDNNLARCTNNLTMYGNYNINVGKISSTSEIEDNRIKYTVNYPLHVSFDDFDFNFPAFYYEQKTNFGRLYNKAAELSESLDDNSFIEEKALDAMSVYESIPFSGTDMSCVPKVWLRSNVEKEIKKALSLNIPFMKVKGTSFSNGNRYYTVDALSGSNSNLKVKFDYSENWPVKMEVHPIEGEILKTDPILPRNLKEMAYISSLLCISDYRFIYDLKFPVLITLMDTETGDIFQFAYMAVIDNNQPKEDKFSEDLEPDTDFICDNAAVKETISVIESAGAGGFEKSKGSEVMFKCANAICNIGITDSNGILEALFPQCVNGFVLANKEGYVSGKEQVDTVDAGSQFTVKLQKLKKLDAKIILLDNNGFERMPSENEIVTVTLTNEDSDYSTMLVSSDNSISIVPGKYKLSAIAVANSEEGFEIPGKDITKCVKVPVKGITGIFGAEEEKCFTASSESITLNAVIIGGSDFEFTIPNDLYDSSSITFYVPVSGIPTTSDQLSGAVEAMEIGANKRLPRLE